MLSTRWQPPKTCAQQSPPTIRQHGRQAKLRELGPLGLLCPPPAHNAPPLLLRLLRWLLPAGCRCRAARRLLLRGGRRCRGARRAAHCEPAGCCAELRGLEWRQGPVRGIPGSSAAPKALDGPAGRGCQGDHLLQGQLATPVLGGVRQKMQLTG